MAMGVVMESSKNLYRHSIPVLLLAFGCLVISIVSFHTYDQNNAGSALLHSLTAGIISVSPERNGLAKVTINHPKVMKPSSQNLNGIAGTAGDAAQLNLTINQAVGNQ
jgi:hypothetical protein